MNTQVVAASGVVVDLSGQLASGDPGQVAQAQTILDMDAYARSKGYPAYNAVPTDEANAVWRAFMDKNSKAAGLPTNAELVAQQALLSSGDARQLADGSWEISDALAADLDRDGSLSRNYGAGMANGAEVQAAVAALVAGASIPATAAAFIATVAASAPDVYAPPAATLTPPPGTMFVDPAPPASPAPALSVTSTSAGPVSAPIADTPVPAATSADVTVNLGNETESGAMWIVAALVGLFLLTRR